MLEVLGIFALISMVLFDLPLWLWELTATGRGAGRSSLDLSGQAVLSLFIVLVGVLAIFLL